MNWKRIATDYPATWALASKAKLSEGHEHIYDFLDSYSVFMLPTCEPEHPQPWGYEVRTQARFVREQCRYVSRAGAEHAGFVQAFQELERLLLFGNS